MQTHRQCLGLLMSALLAVPVTAASQELPSGLGDMLREAKASERTTLENVAKRLYPNQRDQIDDLIDAIEDDEEAAVADSRFIRGWEGEGAVGGSLSTGNTEEWSINTSAKLSRKDQLWEHRFNLDIDLRDVEGARTEESIETGYRASRDFENSAFFSFGQFDYKRDRFQGISRRFTEVVGLGYQILDTDNVDWEVSAGPALRQTRFVSGLSENQMAAFFNVDFEWDITDTLKFSQEAGAVFDSANTTLNTTTAFTSDLYGALSARLSFNTSYESDPPVGKVKLDTTTRASLVYGF